MEANLHFEPIRKELYTAVSLTSKKEEISV